MEHDFVYCPGCRRYAVVHWRHGLGGWQCEDCSYQFPIEEHALATETVAP